MATTKYSDLVTDVLPVLAADPSDPVTEAAIKRAVIEFCAKSWVWVSMPDNISIVAGEPVYDLEPPQGADVVAVMALSIQGAPIENKSVAWLDSNKPNWRTDAGNPLFFTQVDTEQFILAPVPSAAVDAGITLSMALQPTQKATAFPRWIATQYLYDLVDGALGFLLTMPGQPWTDMNLGAAYRDKFATAIAGARADAVSGLGRAPTRTTGQH